MFLTKPYKFSKFAWILTESSNVGTSMDAFQPVVQGQVQTVECDRWWDAFKRESSIHMRGEGQDDNTKTGDVCIKHAVTVMLESSFM